MIKTFLTRSNIILSILVLIIICTLLFFVFYFMKGGDKVVPNEIIVEPPFTNGYDVNKLVGIDEFGRTIQPIFDTKKDKLVGIFYFTWFGQNAGMEGIYDNTDILINHPDDLFNKKGTQFSPIDKYHYWGKPLYGYYNSLDEFVMRKHIEQLTYAGVDFLVLDTTNSFTYDSVWKKLLKLL